MSQISQLAVDRLTKPWEEFVAYPYDDKVPKRRDPATGNRAYPEWTGGPLRGTLTIGYGHTDAAGPVLDLGDKIVPGMRLTEAQGSQLLANDMRPCCNAVNRLVKVPLGQHQADCLDDFVFNCGAGTLAKSTLLRKLNAGDYDAVPAELMKFTLSKGEHMEGLVHRRQAEIAMWNMADEAAPEEKAAIPISPEDHGVDTEDVECPKGELPAARSPLDSKSITAGGTTAATGLALLSSGFDQAAEPVRRVHDTLDQLGLWDQAVNFVTHHPLHIAGAVIVVLGSFVAFDRWRHLHTEVR